MRSLAALAALFTLGAAPVAAFAHALATPAALMPVEQRRRRPQRQAASAPARHRRSRWPVQRRRLRPNMRHISRRVRRRHRRRR